MRQQAPPEAQSDGSSHETGASPNGQAVVRARLEVRRAGSLVAVGAAAWDVIRAGIDEATIQIYVLPDHRNIGIGSTIALEAARRSIASTP